MIIDRIHLEGADSYFDFQPQPGSAGRIARIPRLPLAEGRTYAIEGIQIHFKGPDLRTLLVRQASPVLSLVVNKEMFPSLFARPFESRVYNVGGYEDLNRGQYQDCKTMDVEGVPTLVSTGESDTCRWQSAVNPLATPARLGDIAWELASSRLTPQNSFSYDLTLRYWTQMNGPATDLVIVHNGEPGQVRNRANIPWPNQTVPEVTAFALIFSAKMTRETQLHEAVQTNVLDNLGVPLLKGVYLIEKIPAPMYVFYSLNELLDKCSSYQIYENLDRQMIQLTANVNLKAFVSYSENQDSNPAPANDRFEYLEMWVGENPQIHFMEARTLIEEMRTPPRPLI